MFSYAGPVKSRSLFRTRGNIMRLGLYAFVAGAVGLALVQTASAADMPVKAVSAPIIAPFSWTGIYVGVQGGGAWGRSNETFFGTPNTAIFAGTQNYDISGGALGGVLGFNYQMGSIVLGVEGELNWANINGSSGVVNTGLGDTYYSRVNSYGTVKGRIGYAWDRSLFYVNGGGAWGRVRHEYNAALNGGAANSFSATNNETGWTIGAGWEYAFAPNWSARLEYNYVSLGTGSIQYSAVANNRSEWTDRFSVVKVGVNYKFGWAQ